MYKDHKVHIFKIIMIVSLCAHRKQFLLEVYNTFHHTVKLAISIIITTISSTRNHM